MKRYRLYHTLGTAFALTALCFISCEDIDELPPTSDTNFSNKVYKLADPTLLNEEETAVYNDIKAEYEAGIRNSSN